MLKPNFYLRKLLCQFGYDLHRIPIKSLTLRDLEFDLPKLINRDDPVVVDVGANVGQTIDLVRRTFAKPMIFSFEPNPELWPALRDKYERVGVTVESLALGNSEGNIAFYVSENSELGSVLAPNRGDENPFRKIEIRERVNVSVTSFDTWIDCKKLGRIDLLKVDTQGFDLEVLHGASKTLDRRALEIVLVEVNFIKIYESQCSFSEIQQFMKEKGYGLLTLYEIARIDKCIGWATACFRQFP